MAAQVIMVVEQQDSRFWSGLAIEVSRGETADPGADNDQVVTFAGVPGPAEAWLEGSVPELMRDFVGTRVTSSKSRQCRW
jgi:hypothetical protein